MFGVTAGIVCLAKASPSAGCGGLEARSPLISHFHNFKRNAIVVDLVYCDCKYSDCNTVTLIQSL